MDMGLFSMNFARDKNGNLRTTSRINSAGANVGGLVGLARSVAGLTEAYDNIRIGLSGADEKTAIALRGISTNGQEKLVRASLIRSSVVRQPSKKPTV
jgi:hypothetical protein